MENIIKQIEKKSFLIEKNSYHELSKILVNALQKQRVFLYGGHAIDAILPANKKIYDDDELADFDVYTDDNKSIQKHVISYFKKQGYIAAQFKNAIHASTMRLFVDGMHLADFTQLVKDEFALLYKDTLVINNMRVISVTYSISALHKLLGDLKAAWKWEKTMKRLQTVMSVYSPPKPKALTNSHTWTIHENVILSKLPNSSYVSFGADVLEDYLGIAPEMTPCIHLLTDGDLKEKARELVPNLTKIEEIPATELVFKHINIFVQATCIATLYNPGYCVTSIRYKNKLYPTIHSMLSLYGYLGIFHSTIFQPIWDNLNWLYYNHGMPLPKKQLFKEFSAECIGPYATKFEAERDAARAAAEKK
jgi:Poly(A) polymerase catalytic subunit